MRRKGFTLVELLVVIAIIALLMGILMPALSRVRQLAFRMVCGSNLSGIGKAMLIYANDYDDELPKAGGRGASYTRYINSWFGQDRFQAFGVAPDGSGGAANISSCFYLLVKYAEVTPKSFICKGDAGVSEFKMSDEAQAPANFELIDAWDFGSQPDLHCSYSYHVPFGQYALTTSHEPGFAVAADRNPWISSPGADPRDYTASQWAPAIAPYNAPTERARQGNCNQHQLDGQNVLFLDSHVRFEKYSYCSIEDDNIYTFSTITNRGDPYGNMPTVPAFPGSRKDSLLIHDPAGYYSGRWAKP